MRFQRIFSSFLKCIGEVSWVDQEVWGFSGYLGFKKKSFNPFMLVPLTFNDKTILVILSLGLKKSCLFPVTLP